MATRAIDTLHGFIVGNDTMTWSEAEEWCLNHYGRHLVSIHNDSQNDAASNLCDDCWIGATCKDSDWGDFSWSDGSDWDYTMWDDGEPNNYAFWDDDEDCVQQYSSGFWNDCPCNQTYRPLCGNAGIATLDTL